MSKNQFTGIATQPQCNRKFGQFNNDQYCIHFVAIRSVSVNAVFIANYGRVYKIRTKTGQ